MQYAKKQESLKKDKSISDLLKVNKMLPMRLNLDIKKLCNAIKLIRIIVFLHSYKIL